MTMNSPIVVDPGAVRDLAARIDNVTSELQTAKIDFADNNSVLQSTALDDALTHFNASWSTKRGQLEQMLREAAQLLRTAADDFENVDNELAKGMGATSTTPGDGS